MPRATQAVVFLAPVLLCLVGLSELAKHVFLALAVLFGIAVIGSRPGAYVTHVAWLFILTPGLRHFVDWYEGYSQTNPMMLAPYVVLLLALPSGVLYLLNRRAGAEYLAVMILLVAGGLWVSLLAGGTTNAVLTAVRWISPMLLALFIWSHAGSLEQIRGAVLRTFTCALPLVAVYGLVQFVSILPWDAYYMKMAPIDSIGWPVPFGVRVFATMNHSGSLAAFLSTSILLMLPSMRGLRSLAVLLALCTLFVTTQRAAIGALTLAIVVLAAQGAGGQMGRSLMKLAALLFAALLVALAVPQIGDKLVLSVGSVGSLDTDYSAQERLNQYRLLAQQLAEHPFGWGLAWSSNATLHPGGEAAALDSGIIDIMVSFGLPGGMLFLGVLATLGIQAWRVAASDRQPAARSELAAVVYGLSQLPFGSQHTGEHGVFLYLSLGLLLARRMQNVATGQGHGRVEAYEWRSGVSAGARSS